MTTLLLLSSLLAWFQGPFTSFSFCREFDRGLYMLQCVELDAEGKGTFKFTPRDADMVDVAIELSAGTTGRFLDLLAETDYLEEGDRYESGRNVANLGTKTLTIEGPWGRREAVYNYSTRREVTNLASFFEDLISQETLLFNIELALDFDRLGIPERLEEVERALGSERIVDVERLIPVLDRIAADRRLVNFARSTASRLKEEIEND